MIGAGVLVLAVAVVFAVVGPPLGRRLPPAVATRVLVPATVAVAAATGAVLAIAAFTLVGQMPQIAAAGKWSPQVVREADPVPPVIAVVCGLLVLPAAGRALVVLVRRLRAFAKAQAACRDHPAAGTLIVLDDDRPDAFATPGLRARIVVTTGLLRALDDRQKKAVLAHERSHVTHRHAWWILAADLAAAANPLLAPIARTVSHAVERWADEDAAAEVADRRLVARALGQAALRRHHYPRPTAAPAAVGGDVPDRVRALLAPAPERRLRHLALLAVLLLVIAAGSTLVSERGRELFAQARVPHHHVTAAEATPVD